MTHTEQTLVDRLTEIAASDWPNQHIMSLGADLNSVRHLARTAAAELTTLTADRDKLAAEVERLREALSPFANLSPPAHWQPHEGINVTQSGWITVADIQRAREAIEPARQAQEPTS